MLLEEAWAAADESLRVEKERHDRAWRLHQDALRIMGMVNHAKEIELRRLAVKAREAGCEALADACEAGAEVLARVKRGEALPKGRTAR